MKINRKHIRKLILKEMSNMGPGSFYDTPSGAMFGRLLGVQGLIYELEEAASNIRRIKDVAVRCQSETQVDATDGYVGDQESFDTFQNMIDLCDQILLSLDYQNFLR